MKKYYRPIVQIDRAQPIGALPLAGGWGWFDRVEVLARENAPNIVDISELPEDWRMFLTSERGAIAGLTFDRPRIMGILNATPDSFSDGGKFAETSAAIKQARLMLEHKIDVIDVGGESTRPGALELPREEEMARIAPIISAVRAEGLPALISIDTRKAVVAKAAIEVGANLVNDVSGFTFDPELAPFCARHNIPVCIMHSQGTPETMQKNPYYDNVLLDVYDSLETQISYLVSLGLSRDQIIADPGIGFGKTLAHNLRLLNKLSLFHGLGVPLLLGVSRKGFIRTIGKAPLADQRMPGSVSVALSALGQGVQIVRAHDIAETRQAFDLWRAVTEGGYDDT